MRQSNEARVGQCSVESMRGYSDGCFIISEFYYVKTKYMVSLTLFMYAGVPGGGASSIPARGFLERT